jgi:hypothetical protein
VDPKRLQIPAAILVVKIGDGDFPDARHDDARCLEPTP